MYTILLGALLSAGLPTALAGELVVESSASIELHLDGMLLARLYQAGAVSFHDIPAGPHTLSARTHNQAFQLDVTIGDTPQRVLATTTGLQLLGATTPAPAGLASLELRLGGKVGARVRLGERWYTLSPETPLILPELPSQVLPMELRSADGTAIWARGELDLRAGDSLVLVISEGQAPLVIGREGSWRPGTSRP